MQGYESLYRLRIGQYRLVYQIKQDELIVFVLKEAIFTKHFN